MIDLRLAGCAPTPLAHYLKALGVLRLVSEQADSQAKGYWREDAFVLQSRLDRGALVRFFTSELCPTPIVGPWAGGCGFFPGDNQDGIGAIRNSESPRFAAYRATIAAATDVLAELGIQAKPEEGNKKQKALMIESLRAALPDEAVQWIDSAVALTADGPKYPPLLGTGGNDGRLEFTNNLMKRWAELLLGEAPSPAAWLGNALFADIAADMPVKLKPGQFHPAGGGGYNMTSGFDGDSLVNPWNFVLLLEGALLFASSVTRRLEDTRPGALVYPFTVRASGAGYASAALGDKSRGEIWLPEWSRPSSLNELKCLFAEGRASVRSEKSQRSAANGVDFARALQDLGVQRGVESFTRFEFLTRNGDAHYAVPLGRWAVRRNQAVDILAPLDRWMNEFRVNAAAKLAPASARRALSRLETGVLALCVSDTPSNFQAVLVALGAAEHALTTSKKFTKAAFLRPVFGVGRDWLDRANDGSIEWRLAMALAASGLREHLVPVRSGRWAEHDDGRTVWGERDLVANLRLVARRQALSRDRGVARAESVVFADLPDVAAFIEGSIDDRRIVELLRGAALIDLDGVSPRTLRAATQATQAAWTERRAATPIPYAFAACSLTWQGAVPRSTNAHDDVRLPPAPAVLARLIAGDARGAVDAAHRRLHGSGLPLRAGPRTHVALSPAFTRRIAAAQIFPLSHSTRRTLAADVIVNENPLVETL